MRVCHFCGSDNEDWMKICQVCGNPIISDSSSEDNDDTLISDTYKANESVSKNLSSNKDLKIIIVILLLILVSLIVYIIVTS